MSESHSQNFNHLKIHTQYSICEGAAKIDDLQDYSKNNNLKSIPSSTNFVAIDCGKDGSFAKKVLQELISLGIFVRMPFVTPQDRCIRVSVGEDADLDKFEKALPEALERASK